MNTLFANCVSGYLRLSDTDERITESRSIEMQRNIIEKYALEKGWSVDNFYVDDGYSGTNFDRPGYQQMKKDVESGKVKCIIVKDLSRFGRNAAHMTLELEHFNDDFGLRFISISEDIDARSTDDYNEVFQIILVLNEMYPRDCSKKIKHSWRNGVTDGKFMFGTPPFGYQRSLENPYVMEIDPVAAKYVKRIFDMYITGNSMRAIAELLNQEGVPSPRAYYYEKCNRENPNQESNNWGSNTISVMLDNETYAGTLIQGRRRTVSYKNKNRKMVPPEQWYRTENAHEPIIDSVTWEEAQRLRKSNTLIRKSKSGTVGIFSGLLICGECGSKLARTLSRERPVYRCSRYNTNGSTACTSHRIDEEALAELISKDIKQYASLAHSERENLLHQIGKALENANRESQQDLLNAKKKLKQKIKDNNAAMRTLLDDRAKNLIPDKIYSLQLFQLNEELEKLEADLCEIQTKIVKKSNEDNCISKWVGKIDQYLDLSIIDRIAVTSLIESIIVHEEILSTGKRHFVFEIFYRFVGNLSGILEKKDIA